MSGSDLRRSFCPLTRRSAGAELAALARAEMTEALPILAARLPNLELAGPPTWRPELSGFVGPLTLPIRFDGGPAVR